MYTWIIFAIFWKREIFKRNRKKQSIIYFLPLPSLLIIFFLSQIMPIAWPKNCFSFFIHFFSNFNYLFDFLLLISIFNNNNNNNKNNNNNNNNVIKFNWEHKINYYYYLKKKRG